MKVYKIVAINLGSTSTKIAYYENDRCVLKENLSHQSSDLKGFATVWEQYDYRMDAICGFLDAHGIRVEKLDAFVTRGGHTKPLSGGVYRVNELMLEQSRSERYGNHPPDLGLQIAWGFARYGPVPLTVDPPTTDEFEPRARYSGLAEMPRRSSFQVLNHRAVGKQFAKDQGKDYRALNLIVAHMGGGITVAAHKKGRLVDANNGIAGDGPFSTNRTGTLPVGALVDACYSGAFTYQQMMRKINGEGGLMAYLGDADAYRAEQEAAKGSQKHREALEAMCYQTSKEIAACAAVLCGEVDAIIITGGMAHSLMMMDWIRRRVEFIAPVALYPGEYEMQSLALSAYDALRGMERIKELV